MSPNGCLLPSAEKVTNTLLQHKPHWYGTDVTEWELKAAEAFVGTLKKNRRLASRLPYVLLLKL